MAIQLASNVGISFFFFPIYSCPCVVTRNSSSTRSSPPYQGNLYAVRWYFNKEEFYSYLPKESPPERVFSVTGITIDVRNPIT